MPTPISDAIRYANAQKCGPGYTLNVYFRGGHAIKDLHVLPQPTISDPLMLCFVTAKHEADIPVSINEDAVSYVEVIW